MEQKKAESVSLSLSSSSNKLSSGSINITSKKRLRWGDTSYKCDDENVSSPQQSTTNIVQESTISKILEAI